MSNTATTAMMMTVILPIMAQCDKNDQFRTALALSIPIAANIGGIATPIGTPPNAIVLANLHTQGISISFTDWMLLTTPFVLMVLFFSWWVLRWMFPAQIQSIKTSNAAGFNTSAKAIVFYSIFATTLVLWVTESIHGISSNIVALLPVTALALTKVLEVEDIRKLPWEVLWLVAGGLALGLYLDQTGLADYMVRAIDWTSISGFTIIAMFGAVAWLLSNFLSNTVAATLLMPLAISIGILQGSGELELIELALVIGVGTSLAMLLPISTPPNAIAVATGMVKTSDMVKSGAVIGVIGIMFMLVMAVIYWPLIVN
jgi:sodium-dependent dicarboxylate transporter 2/3/5